MAGQIKRKAGRPKGSKTRPRKSITARMARIKKRHPECATDKIVLYGNKKEWRSLLEELYTKQLTGSAWFRAAVKEQLRVFKDDDEWLGGV